MMSSGQPHALLFVAPNLGGGGGERALVNIVNHLDRARFRPHLALFQREGVFLRELASDVPVHEIQPKEYGFVHRTWVRTQALRRLYEEVHPALIMSILWQANAVTLLAAGLWRFPIPIVINEQTAPQASLRSDSRRRLLWPIASRLYCRATHIICISQGIATEVADSLPIAPGRISVIHNPVPIHQVVRCASQTVNFRASDAPAILAAGRLVSLKNYPLLLRAIALVLPQQDVELYILGEGPERAAIENLAVTLGISTHVHLLGFQPNPYPYIAQADLFTLSSDHEGFGNVLVEAMSLGVPVVATDCPYGPREILADGRYDLLVPPGDERALAEAILALLRDTDARCRLAAEGRKRAKDFSTENVVTRYEQLFQDLIACQSNHAR
jgi:glycosyltransferase involved in cell wall biosynthesis